MDTMVKITTTITANIEIESHIPVYKESKFSSKERIDLSEKINDLKLPDGEYTIQIYLEKVNS